MPAAGAFRSLAGNKALVRVVGGYVLFTLTEYSVWVAMLVLGYAPTQRQAERIADTQLAADAAPADSDTAG